MIRTLVTESCHFCKVLQQTTHNFHALRCVSTASPVWKRYKFSLDPKNLASGDSGGGGYRRSRKDFGFVDGERVSFFQFDDLKTAKLRTREQIEERGPSQRHNKFALSVIETIDAVLNSTKAPQILNDCQIEILDVGVNHNLTSATIIWCLPEFPTPYSKEETAYLLEQYLPEIRGLYPIYSSHSAKPILRFVYGTKVKDSPQNTNEYVDYLE